MLGGKTPNCMMLTQGVGGLKIQPSSIVRKEGLWAGVWAPPVETCASQADKGVFRKVVNRRVGERRRLGRGGRGSLFPSRLVGSEDMPEPRQSGQASPGLWGSGPWLATLESESGRDEAGERRRHTPPRRPLRASLSRRQEGGAYPEYSGSNNRPGMRLISRATFLPWPFLDAAGRWALPRAPRRSRRRAQAGARRSGQLGVRGFSCTFFGLSLLSLLLRDCAGWARVHQTEGEVRGGATAALRELAAGVEEWVRRRGRLYCRNQAPFKNKNNNNNCCSVGNRAPPS